ncbi:MAG: Uracil-DNA glycosylase [Parcubacteria group bacterium GW2011_GWA2_47_8b]|nr:MAG: Uracil-DNA glycosylase [Parcubacteria group bacterium GW2011_GWA2_47_8b]
MNYFNPNLKISRDHGKIFRMNGRLLVPFYHPAAILRNMGLINEYEKEFKKLPKIAKKAEELLKKP